MTDTRNNSAAPARLPAWRWGLRGLLLAATVACAVVVLRSGAGGPAATSLPPGAVPVRLAAGDDYGEALVYVGPRDPLAAPLADDESIRQALRQAAGGNKQLALRVSGGVRHAEVARLRRLASEALPAGVEIYIAPLAAE